MRSNTYVPHCTLLVCNSYVRCLCTSPPVHSILYTVSSSISGTVSAASLAIALPRLDIWLQSEKIGEYPTKHIQGAVSMLSCFLAAHLFVITQANNDKSTCFTMAGCHTVLTPIEKQSGQQVLYACHLSYLSEWGWRYPINTPHVQQQFDLSWNKHMKKWGYLLVVADMSYSGKLCLAII